MKSTCLLLTFLMFGDVNGCVTDSSAGNEQTGTVRKIKELRAACNYPGNYDGCESLEDKSIILSGTLYFPDRESSHARLLTIGTQLVIDDYDHQQSSNDLHDYIDLKMDDMLVERKLAVFKLNGSDVIIDAKIITGCVVAHFEVNNAIIEPMVTLSVAGYCRTRHDVYLSDFTIKEMDVQ